MADKSIPVEHDELPKSIQPNTVLFVYMKNDEAKVLSFDQAKDQHEYLIRSKWKHTGTIESQQWVELLLNEDQALKMINDLKNGG